MPDFASLPLESLAEAVGGAGLFIFGMKTMSAGIQQLAGNRFKSLLEKAVANRFSAALLGTCLSSVLQSSSSASILVVGFLNAGLLSLYQALAILLGTAAGSAVAVQFIAFQSSSLALVAIFCGILLKSLSKRRSLADSGELLLGAGLLFLGLRIMESGLTPISQSAILRSLNDYVFAWRISAVLFGALITFVTQSVSIATGIIIAFSGSGLISFTESVGMVIGGNLGIAFITLFAAMGGTAIARRAALINLLINFMAVVVAIACFPLFIKSVAFISPVWEQMPAEILISSRITLEKNYLPRLIANSHTLYSILMLLVFLPFIGFFARSRSLKGKSADLSSHPAFLDQRVLNTPTIAMLQAKSEITRMSVIAAAMYDDLVHLFYRFDARNVRKIVMVEETLDTLQKDISNFLVLLSRRVPDAESSARIPELLQLVNQIEHLGDLNMKLLACMQKKKAERIHFSIHAMTDLKRLAAAVAEMVQLVDLQAAPPEDGTAMVARLAQEIEEISAAALAGHVKRMKTGHCTVEAGLLYNDLLTALQNIAACATSIFYDGSSLQ
jgi:phosphate:Na+ symporter